MEHAQSSWSQVPWDLCNCKASVYCYMILSADSHHIPTLWQPPGHTILHTLCKPPGHTILHTLCKPPGHTILHTMCKSPGHTILHTMCKPPGHAISYTLCKPPGHIILQLRSNKNIALVSFPFPVWWFLALSTVRSENCYSDNTCSSTLDFQSTSTWSDVT